MDVLKHPMNITKDNESIIFSVVPRHWCTTTGAGNKTYCTETLLGGVHDVYILKIDMQQYIVHVT